MTWHQGTTWDTADGNPLPRGPLNLPKRLYQCPGCWSFDALPRVTEEAYIECRCGERMTLIDLRERREQPLNEDAH